MKIPETAFFCTCEDAYLVPSIITLESIRQFHPDADCFIMGTFKQPNFLEWIGKFSIRYIPIRETDFFQDTYLIKDHTPMWPRECFWHLFTYHYLKEMGYSRSCCVDGDVLCVSPINMAEVFDSTTPLSVVHKRNGSINSGVLFYNHDMMEELKFSHLIKDFYQNRKTCGHNECKGFCLEKGDQDLLEAVLEHNRIQYKVLPSGYNYLLHFPLEKCLRANAVEIHSISECAFLHIMYKPWIKPPPNQTLYPLLQNARRLWAAQAKIVLEKIKG